MELLESGFLHFLDLHEEGDNARKEKEKEKNRKDRKKNYFFSFNKWPYGAFFGTM